MPVNKEGEGKSAVAVLEGVPTANGGGASAAASGSGSGGGGGGGGSGSRATDFDWYRDVIRISVADKQITPEEDNLIQGVKAKLKISDAEHIQILKDLGMSESDYDGLKKDPYVTADLTADLTALHTDRLTD